MRDRTPKPNVEKSMFGKKTATENGDAVTGQQLYFFFFWADRLMARRCVCGGKWVAGADWQRGHHVATGAAESISSTTCRAGSNWS